ncbi:MAG: CPBP family intramembrane glutamic endopeptidase [Chitinophagaceae bacterium]
MLGVLVQLLISWGILYLYNRKGLWVLGLKPTWLRARLVIIFLVFAFLCASSAYVVRNYVGKETWDWNPGLTPELFWNGVRWNLQSVWFEELIFRGAIFYILLDRMKPVAAIAISAVAFGIYHWFSYGVFGEPVNMIFVFLTTGLVGVVYAYGFAKTRTMWVPFALHFGWNFTNNFVFSSGQIGNGVWMMTHQPVIQVSTWAYYLAVWNPIVMYIVGGFLLIKLLRADSF